MQLVYDLINSVSERSICGRSNKHLACCVCSSPTVYINVNSIMTFLTSDSSSPWMERCYVFVQTLSRTN